MNIIIQVQTCGFKPLCDQPWALGFGLDVNKSEWLDVVFCGKLFIKACFMQSHTCRVPVLCCTQRQWHRCSLFCSKAVVCWESTWRWVFQEMGGSFQQWDGCTQSAHHTLVKWSENISALHEAEHSVWPVLWFCCLTCFTFLVQKSFCQWNPRSSIALSV